MAETINGLFKAEVIHRHGPHLWQDGQRIYPRSTAKRRKQMMIIGVHCGGAAREVGQDVDSVRGHPELPGLGIVAVGGQRGKADQIARCGAQNTVTASSAATMGKTKAKARLGRVIAVMIEAERERSTNIRATTHSTSE